MIRILFLKLINGIDTNRLSSVFELLIEHLAKSDISARLTLFFKVLNTSVALKFGRRISQGSVLVIT